MVLWRHLVIGNPLSGNTAPTQTSFVIAIRRHALPYYVLTKPRAIIHAEDATDYAGSRADCAANYRAKRARVALPCSVPSCAPRIVPCACSATGSARAAITNIDPRSLLRMFPLHWLLILNTNEAGIWFRAGAARV
jgi:hypothetical protein